MLAVGDVIASKYRVDRILGTGGMGVVVAATHVRLQQPVALKFLLPAHVASPEAVERFAREARASAQLRNEHVCRVSDVDAFDDGSPYIVMELLDGLDLASLLKRTGALPVATACDYALEACLGVAEAHALGIVHRDLKPANLFLTNRPDGRPLIKVLDFGIAKASSERGFDLTQTSVVLGSPGYMSPEQLRSSRQVDVRSDIWGIGVTLYELTSGRPPFTGATITELALRIAMDPPEPLHNTPPEFEAVVARCLAKEPGDRYADLAQLARALVPFADDGGSELASSVEQMLRHRTAAPLPVMPVAAPVPPTQPMTASDLRLLPTQLPEPTTPTTLGSAASSSISSSTIEVRSASPFVVSSQDGSHPFLMFTYMAGGGEQGMGGLGDADFVRLVPPAQYLRHYTFFTDTTFAFTTLTVVREKTNGNFQDVSLACAGKLGGWQPVGASGRFEITFVKLADHFNAVGTCANGVQTMSSNGGFGVWAWGWGSEDTNTGWVSYGFAAGEAAVSINNVVP